MYQKTKSVLYSTLTLLFWAALWQISSIIIGNDFLVPGIVPTFKALFILMGDVDFYLAIFLSLLRVIAGLVLGIVFGVLIAIASYKIVPICRIVSPAVSVIKSTPVASFIVILWIMMSGDSLSIFISFLMVFPIIWQNTLDGFRSVDTHLLEIAYIFKFSGFKKFKLVFFPCIIKFLIPAIITSVGLAWKAEIAAEIIAYTSKSIGHLINESKTFFDTPKVFALTLVIIFFSVMLEFIAKKALRRIKT